MAKRFTISFVLAIWQRCKKITSQIKHHNDLIWLQTQIVRNTLKTNSIVSKFVPTVNENCTFGCVEKETILHLFYQCVHTNNFLKDINQWLINVHNKYSIPVNRLNILFGIHNEEANSERNLLIMVAKKYIWLEKFRELAPTLNRFQSYLLDFLLNLKAIHAIKNDTDQFAEDWDALIVHIQVVHGDG